MKCPTCGHDPDDIQQKRAAVSRWSVMSKKEKSAEMSRIRRKGMKKAKRVAGRSNQVRNHPFVSSANGEKALRELFEEAQIAVQLLNKALGADAQKPGNAPYCLASGGKARAALALAEGRSE